GFTFEGVFRKHMVVKGRNRDTAWYAITDEQWPRIRAAFENWLSAENFDASGAHPRALGALVAASSAAAEKLPTLDAGIQDIERERSDDFEGRLHPAGMGARAGGTAERRDDRDHRTAGRDAAGNDRNGEGIRGSAPAP